jgi:hypothetical protein
MDTFFKRLIVAALSLSLVGCHAHQEISAPDKARIKAATIDKDVTKPADMWYFGPGMTFLFLGGAIGGAVAGAVSMGPAEALKTHAEKNNVVIEKIVTEEFMAELKRTGKLGVTDDPAKAQANIKLTLKMYGFSVPHGFSGQMKPVLTLQCEMFDPVSNKLVWASSSYQSPLGDHAEPVSVESLQDPKELDRLWRLAAKGAAKDIVGEL